MLNDFFVYVYLPLGLNIRKINGSGQAYLITRDKSDASKVFSDRPEKTISYDSQHPGQKIIPETQGPATGNHEANNDITNHIVTRKPTSPG
jgi:hypothetical protein